MPEERIKPYAKPAGDLQVKKNTDSAGWTTAGGFATAFTGVPTAATTYATGTRGIRTSTQDYKFLLDLSIDIPGNYSLVVTYTGTTL